jgi:hypothetical protein
MAQLDANHRSEERSGAVRAIEQVMESLRMQDPASLPDTGSSPPQLVVVGGREFEVVTHYCVKPEYCDTSARHLEVEVSHEGRKIYAIETIYTQLL